MTCSCKPSPLSLLSFYDPEAIAPDIVHLWRSGSRHPRLARQIQDLYPGLPLEPFNEAAGIAWNSLTAEERRLALGEAHDAEAS